MSADCDYHEGERRALYRKICAGIAVFIVLVLLTILIIWAVLQPKKPTFILQDATIYAFNQTSPDLLTSNFQVTLVARNPNKRIGIYYDRLKMYVSYREQQITLSTSIPPTYQGHKEMDIWSPFLGGNQVPISPFNALALPQDKLAGAVWITVKADGRVRFKVGAFVSKRYHLFVQCRTYIRFGTGGGYGMKLIGMNKCKVTD